MMKKLMFMILGGLLFVIGLGLLYLTNTGLVSFGKSYVSRLSVDLPAAPPLVAFVNVQVIPMDRPQVLADQTVIVRDGRIAVVGDRGTVSIPEAAQVIDGQGGYLLPGLVDMHVHIEDENDLLLYAANGVTTVRNLWGNTEKKLWMGMPDQLVLRERINRGELFGPTIYTAGPIMEGNPATTPLMPVFTTPEQAAASVAWQKAQGYDFIKVYDHLSIETYQAVLQAAREQGLPVVGHVPFEVGLDAALAGGQATIEHLSGYIDPDAAEFLIPEDQLANYAEKTQQAGVWNVPTIGIYQNTVPSEEIQSLEAQPGVEYMSPLMRVLMRFFIGQLSRSIRYTGDDYPGRIADMYLRMTRALHEAGAKVVVGTDANNSYLVPGYSLHAELDYLVQAGFSPYEALAAGTRDAAEALGKADEFGTIEPDRRADLILLAENPLDDVAHLRQRAGVMLRGRWLPAAELQTRLDELAASFRPNVFERIWPLGLIGLGLFFVWRSFA
jgi:imidazolonepropionase-like amidohydrolase